MGSEASTLRVEDSIFDANAVRAPMDKGGVDVTVRVNTGGFSIGGPTYFVPIWRVDDGRTCSSSLCVFFPAEPKMPLHSGLRHSVAAVPGGLGVLAG